LQRGSVFPRRAIPASHDHAAPSGGVISFLEGVISSATRVS